MSTRAIDYAGEIVNGNPDSIWCGVRMLETPHVLDRYFELSDSVRNTGLLITEEVDDAIFVQARAEIILNRPEFAGRKAAMEKIATGT